MLASASPRRHELLLAAQIPHLVQPSSVDETRLPAEEAIPYVRRLAQLKAEQVPVLPGQVILGADTVVHFESEVLGKPASDLEAFQMLELLSSRVHLVSTGICLRTVNSVTVDVSTTRVGFVSLSASEIQDYLSTGEHHDKAGAYAIQGVASRFVSFIEGSYHNVVGLPVSLVYRHLLDLGG